MGGVVGKPYRLELVGGAAAHDPEGKAAHCWGSVGLWPQEGLYGLGFRVCISLGSLTTRLVLRNRAALNSKMDLTLGPLQRALRVQPTLRNPQVSRVRIVLQTGIP